VFVAAFSPARAVGPRAGCPPVAHRCRFSPLRPCTRARSPGGGVPPPAEILGAARFFARLACPGRRVAASLRRSRPSGAGAPPRPGRLPPGPLRPGHSPSLRRWARWCGAARVSSGIALAPGGSLGATAAAVRNRRSPASKPLASGFDGGGPLSPAFSVGGGRSKRGWGVGATTPPRSWRAGAAGRPALVPPAVTRVVRGPAGALDRPHGECLGNGLRFGGGVLGLLRRESPLVRCGPRAARLGSARPSRGWFGPTFGLGLSGPSPAPRFLHRLRPRSHSPPHLGQTDQLGAGGPASGHGMLLVPPTSSATRPVSARAALAAVNHQGVGGAGPALWAPFPPHWPWGSCRRCRSVSLPLRFFAAIPLTSGFSHVVTDASFVADCPRGASCLRLARPGLGDATPPGAHPPPAPGRTRSSPTHRCS